MRGSRVRQERGFVGTGKLRAHARASRAQLADTATRVAATGPGLGLVAHVRLGGTGTSVRRKGDPSGGGSGWSPAEARSLAMVSSRIWSAVMPANGLPASGDAIMGAATSAVAGSSTGAVAAGASA